MPEEVAVPRGASPSQMPDPAGLTREQLYREIAGLRELLLTTITAKDQNVRELIITRLEAMDKAITLLQSVADRQPTPNMVLGAVDALSALTAEKFASIAIQFRERDTRTEQTFRDTKIAVDAALQAAKEAVAEQVRSSALAISKSETATSKQIDQQSALIASGSSGLDDKIDDMKERVARIEAGGAVQSHAETTQRETSQFSQSYIVAIIGALIGIGGLILALSRNIAG